jgi:glycosyltransferase involved in cell wall biosynthesis
LPGESIYKSIKHGINILKNYGFFAFVKVLHNKLFIKRNASDQISKETPSYGRFTPLNPLKKNTKGRDILFVSHELCRTGAPIALLDFVRVVLNNGDCPVVASLSDGPLRQNFLDMGVTVIIDAQFTLDNNACNYNLIVMNTLLCYKVIPSQNISLPPVLLWVHESGMALKFIKKLPKRLPDNINVYSVSDYSINSLKSSGLSYKYGKLLYGVPDVPPSGNAHKSDEVFTFLTIGTIDRRKGQDLLIKAVKSLDNQYLPKIKFVFIGNAFPYDPVFKELINLSNKNKNIIWINNIPREEVWEWYQKADCLIVPSREDPLPIVVSEAMMFSLPVITSDQVGEIEYVIHNETALVFPINKLKILSELIIYAVNNREHMVNMGKRARKEIYEKHFTMEVFKKNVLSTIDEITKNK